MSDIRKQILRLIPNFLDARKEIESIQGEIKGFYIDLAYGVTPALFITVERFGDSYLERVRLEAPNELAAEVERLKANKWIEIKSEADLPNDGRYYAAIVSGTVVIYDIMQIYKGEWTTQEGELLESNWKVGAWHKLPAPFQSLGSGGE